MSCFCLQDRITACQLQWTSSYPSRKLDFQPKQMFASRTIPWKIGCRTLLLRNDASKVKNLTSKSLSYLFPSTKCTSVTLLNGKKSTDGDEKPKKVYLNTLDPNLFNLGGITEEMLAKKNRISSSICKETTTFTSEMINGLGRKDLQKVCKAIGINQASKSSVLAEKIMEYIETNELSGLTFHPFCNPKKPSSLAPGIIDPLSIKLNTSYLEPYGRLYEGQYPSVTTVLKHTRSDRDVSRLENWEKKEINKIGQEKFDIMMQKTLNNGKQLHKTIAEWLEEAHKLEKKDREAFQNDLGLLQTSASQQKFRQDFFKSKLDQIQHLHEGSLLYNQLKSLLPVLVKVELVVAIESGVVCELLGYAGTCDCICVYEDQLCLFDWKTSKKKKKSLKSCYDYPVQLAAYAGAVNQDASYNFGVESAAIVFAYEDGSPADVHMLTCNQCEQYWDQWQSRLQLYKNDFELLVIEEQLEEDIEYLDDSSEQIINEGDKRLMDESSKENLNAEYHERIKDNVEIKAQGFDFLAREALEKSKSQSEDATLSDFHNNQQEVVQIRETVHQEIKMGPTQVSAKLYDREESLNNVSAVAGKQHHAEVLGYVSEGICNKQEVSYSGKNISVQLDPKSVFQPEEELEAIREKDEIYEFPLRSTEINQDIIVEESINEKCLSENTMELKMSENVLLMENYSNITNEIKAKKAEKVSEDDIHNEQDILCHENDMTILKNQDDFRTEYELSNFSDNSVATENKMVSHNNLLSENILHKETHSFNETVNTLNQKEKKVVKQESPNMTSLKSEFPKTTTMVSKVERGDTGQFAKWYMKGKFDSLKKYITSFWL